METGVIIGGVSILLNLVVLYVNSRSRADVAELKAAFYDELREYVRRDEIALPRIYPTRRRERS